MQRLLALIVGYLLLEVCLPPFSTVAEQMPQAVTNLQDKYTNALQEIERLQRELANAKKEIEHLKQQLERANSSRSAKESEEKKGSSEEKKYRDAIASLTKNIESNPQDATSYRNRAIAHSRLGNYKQAMQDFNKAIGLNIEDAVAYNQRGILHYQLENYQQAIGDFGTAIEHNPKLAESYNNRGLSYRKLGNYGEAIKALRRAAQLGLEFAPQYLQVLREEIRQAQERLQQADFTPGPADGIPGAQTTAALRAYQRRQGLPVTGLLDDRTKAALGIRPGTPSVPPPQESDVSSRFVQQPKPEYPLLARQQGWEGTVTLRFEMLADGTIGKVEIAKSSGYPVLDTAAQNAVKQWTHRPTTRNEIPVTRWTTLDFSFTLDKGSETGP